MTTRLEHHIKKELYSKRVFTLPGLGSFYLKREAANFSEDKSTIYPPNFHLFFTDTHVIEHPLDPAFESEVKVLTDRINHDLNNTGKAKIRGLGVFQKESDKFNFYPDKELEKAFGLGLQPIYNVKEVNKTFTGSPTRVAETLVVQKPKKDYTALWKSLRTGLYIVLALGAIYGLLNIPIHFGDNNSPIIKQYKKPQPLPPVVKDTIIQALDTAAEKPDTIAIQVEPPKPEPIPQAQEKPVHIKNNTKNVKSKLKKHQSGKAHNIVLPAIKVDSNEISPITGRACAVITGSFKQKHYALTMVKKLQKLGYKVYTEQKEGFTRVGLLYECSKTNADSLLKEIRVKIDSTSWILE